MGDGRADAGDPVGLEGAFTRAPGEASAERPESPAVEPSDRYELLGTDLREGVGGSAIVWRARDRMLDRIVALKLARPDSSEEAFRLEYTRAAEVFHPNLPPVLDAGHIDGCGFYTMPWVGERTLLALIAGGGVGHRALQVVAQVASALARLHDRADERAHGDVSPRNIRVGEDGAVWLVDAGQSRSRGQRVPHRWTPGYAADEVVRGEPPDPASDVWALGALVAVAWTGRPDGEPAEAPLRSLIRCCRDPDPKRRPSADAVADEIGRWLAGEPIRSHRYSLFELFLRRWRAWAAQVALAGLAVGLGSALLAYGWAQAARADARELEARHAEAARWSLRARRLLDEGGDPAVVQLLATRALALTADPVTRGTLVDAASRWRPGLQDTTELPGTGAVTCFRVDRRSAPVDCERNELLLASGPSGWRTVGPGFAALAAEDGGATVVRADALEVVSPGGIVLDRAPLPEGSELRMADLSPEGVVLVRTDGAVEVLRPDGTAWWTARAPDPEVRSMSADLRRGTIVVGDWKGRVAVLSEGAPPRVVQDSGAHGATVVAVSYDGRLVATGWREEGGDRNAVRLLGLDGDDPPRVLLGHAAHPTALSFAPGRPILASGDQVGGVRLWDTDTGRAMGAVRLPDRVAAMWWSSDGTELQVLGRDARVRTFFVPTDTRASVIARSGGVVFKVRAAGPWLATAGEEGLKAWHDGQPVPLPPFDGRLMALALGGDGSAASVTPDGRLVAVDLVRGAVRVTDPVEGLALAYDAVFTPDGRWLVLAAMGVQGMPGRLWAFEWPSLAAAGPPLDVDRGSVLGLTVVDHGSAVVAVSLNGRVVKVGVPGLEVVRELAAGGPLFGNVAARPGTHELAMAERSRDGAVVRMDARTGATVARLPLPSNGQSAVAWSPTGRWLAATDGPQIHLWKADLPEPLAVIEDAHEGEEVWSLAFVTDDRLYSAGADGATRAWDLRPLSASPEGWANDLLSRVVEIVEE